MNHHVIVIHGIGKAQPGYSREFCQGIEREYKTFGRPQHASPDTLIFHEVLWDDILAREQAMLADVLRKGFGLAARGSPVGLFEKIFGWAKRLINVLRTDIAAEYIGDILSYRETQTYAMIHERLKETLQVIAQETQPACMSIAAHSLGTVIASDHIFDLQKKSLKLAGNVPLRNFFTLGSPIALFALRYGGAELFASPAKIEDPAGVWLNIFDKDDPVGYPLKTLNESYGTAVAQDVLVNTGLFGLSHTQYFRSKDVHRLIAEKLL